MYDFIVKNQKILAWLAIIPCVLLNCGAGQIKEALALPIYMDTFFTVVAAALFGLGPGLLVGLCTNGLTEIIAGFPGYEWPFAIVNAFSALMTWIAVRHGWLKRFNGILGLLACLTLGNSLLGALIATVVFGGIIGGPNDIIVQSLAITGQSIFSSAFLGRIFLNLVDKGLAILIMLPLYRLYRTRVLRPDSI